MFPQLFGKYVLERELASGGMARVFLATLRGAGGFEKRLCVKQIRPELASDQCFIRRFVAEAKTTVELSHANIVPVYELGAEQGTYYIAMELCPGVSLAELLRAGPASPSEGAYIGVEICRALDYAHRKAGVVHRDVTPRNVMIDPEGMVRLIDFGIAAPASSNGGGGPAFGSPGHMPPEQLRAGPLTPAADVFAVAVLLIEAWTGRAPFRRESFQASVEALGEAPPPLGASDPALAALEPLIESALAHAASERPQTAEELARPLREFLRSHDLGDIARRLGERVSERLRQHGSEARREPGSVETRAEVSALAAAHTPTGTATFAARDVLREWTAKIESSPPALAGGLLGDNFEIDSGVTASSPSASSTVQRGRRLRRVASGMALAAGAVLALGLMVQRWLLVPAEAELVAPALDAAPARQATRLPMLSALQRPDPASAPLDPARPPASAPRPAPTPPDSRRAADLRTAPRTGNGASAPLARLQLTAEPGAWVEIDATRVGNTPLLNHGSSPGRHTIRFVNPLLGEKLEASVILEPRSVTRIHADFTSANPRVYVR